LKSGGDQYVHQNSCSTQWVRPGGAALKPAFVLAKNFQSEILLLRIATPEEVVVGFSAMPLYPCDLRNVEEEPSD
jgi:hypothetical protein